MNVISTDAKLDALKQVPQYKLQAISRLEKLLAMSGEEKRREIERKLAEQLKYAFRNSEYYRQHFGEAGITSEEQLSPDRFRDLPFITKADIRNAYPWKLLAGSMADVGRYAESTGTTGTPTSAYFSRNDWLENNVFVGYRLLDMFTPDDVVVIAAPYELSIPAQDLERIFEMIGPTTIACGVLNEVCNWDRLLHIIEHVKPTALVCSATRALLIAETAVQMGLDPVKDLSIRKILNIGETANQPKSKKISEVWGAEVYNAYGMTESCAMGISCKHGHIHLIQERYYFEVIDPVTKQPLPQGEVGELVITSLSNQSMPLIRYRTNDLVCISESGCPCGDRAPILEHYGRIGEEIRFEKEQIAISYPKLEEKILKCESYDKFFKVELDAESFEIIADLKPGYTIDQFRDEMKEQLPLSIHHRFTARTFTPYERARLLDGLKNSLKPFGKLFSQRTVQA